MLKARTSFPPVIYENSEHDDDRRSVGRIADIMSRYYTRIGEIVQAEIMKQKELAGIQPADNACQSTEQSNPANSTGRLYNALEVPGIAQQDIREPLDIIRNSRLKVRQISNDFNRTDDDMKKLEREGQILGMVRKNLDNMTRKFWD